MKEIVNLLQKNSYPGRGIIFGRSADGKKAVAAYFIMGRSSNSRNRIFKEDGKGICTKAYDESKMEDPSLIIYSPVRVLGNFIIVTNGDQTDTVYDFIRRGESFEEALRTRCFEPDSPNFTPRISGLLDMADGGYKLSILKCDNNKPPNCIRFFFEYDNANAGEGHFIHTYDRDGDPLLSFVGEPKKINIPATIDDFSNLIWDNLDEDNKVSLFVRYIDLKTKGVETRIYNKNE